MPTVEQLLSGGRLTDPSILTSLRVDTYTGFMRLPYANTNAQRLVGLMLPIPGDDNPLPDQLVPYETYNQVPEGYRNSGYLGRVGIFGRRLSESTHALHGTAEGFRGTVGLYETEIDLAEPHFVDLRDYFLEEGIAAQARSVYRQKVYAPCRGNEALAERADRKYPLAEHILYNQPPDGDKKRKARRITNPHNLRPLLLIARTPLTKIAELVPLEVTYSS